jgi:hypothetical protein
MKLYRKAFLSLLIATLGACGGGGDESTSPVVNVTAPVNVVPVVNAGEDQSINENSNVTLSASGSDSDGSISTYSWKQVSGNSVTITTSDSASASFTAPAVTNEIILIFEVTVTDDDGAIAKDGVSINILPVNEEPLVSAGDDQSVDENTNVVLSADASDPDDNISSYSWLQISGDSVTITDSEKANASFTAPEVTNEIALIFEITVTDDDGAIAKDEVSIKILPVNEAPLVSAGDDQSVDENTNVLLSAVASDSDDNISNYSWTQISGDTVTLAASDTATTSFISPIVTKEVTLVFKITVTDDDGAMGKDEISIKVLPVNLAPVVNAGDDQSVEENTNVVLSAVASDTDGSVSTYSWSQVSGGKVTLTASDTVSASFTSPMLTEEVILTFELTVTDNEGLTTTDIVLITVVPVPLKIELNGPYGSLSPGAKVVITSSSDIPILKYQWSHETNGTSILSLQQIDTEQSSLSFTIPSSETNSILIKLVVTDSVGDSAQALFTVNIKQALFAQTDSIVNLNQADINLVADGDIDGDGDIEFVVAQGTQLKVYQNNAGTWTSTYIADIIKYSNFLYGIELALIDNDNFLDIIISDGEDETYWYKNNGDGSFNGTANTISRYHSGEFIVTDLDNDGDNDIVIMNAGINFKNGIAHSVFTHNINNGSGVFTRGANNLVPYSTMLTTKKLDADSLPDYLFYQANNDRLTWYRYEGIAGSSDEITFMANLVDDEYIKDIKIVDINKDGINDILFSTQKSNEKGYIKCLLANTYGDFSIEKILVELSEGVLHFEVADFNNDGELDIIAQESSNKNINLHLNDNGSYTESQLIAESDYDPHLKLKDYNDDGYIDIRLVNDGNVIVYKNKLNY